MVFRYVFNLWIGLGLAGLAVCALPPQAQAQGVSIIRDAETEQLLREYVTPIFKAAGIRNDAVKIILVGDKSFNAFVADGQKIFVNVGALMEAKTPNEIIGVLAHESGHIAGGHLVQMHQELARAQVMSVAGMLMSAGAVYGSSHSSSVGADGAGTMGMMLGPQELVRRSLLSYQRIQEQAADRAAVTYLDSAHESAAGLLSTLQRFQNEALFRSAALDPYLLTHPLPAERLSNLETIAHQSPNFNVKDSPALQSRHDLMRAKLTAFLSDTSEIARRYPVSDTSLAARYARAITAYRFGRVEDALHQIDALIQAQPQNPYFHELKGQALLEAGRARDAIPQLEQAVAGAPNGTPIRVMLGHALVAEGHNMDAAIKQLENATQHDSDSAEAFEYLAMAYAQKGNLAGAQLASAQRFFATGDYVEARTQATRAQARFKTGSPGWLKADDILNYRPPKLD